MGRLPSIRTLVLEAPISAVTVTIEEHVFQWTGSNCSLIDDTFYYQNYDARHLFNYTCQPNVTGTLNPGRIGTDLLEIPGLLVVPKKNSSNVALTFIHVTTNGFINEVGNVVTNEVQLELKSCPMERTKTGRSSTQPIGGYPVYKEVFVISQVWNGYFHIVVEQMSRLAPYICFLKRHPLVKIHMNINDDMLGVVKDYFRMLGISSSRIITGVIRAQVLYIPAGTPCTNPPLFPARILSLWLRFTMSTQSSGPRNNIVLIKRKVGRKRWFHNHKSIRKRLLDLITRVDDEFILDDLKDPVPPLNQVARMFSRAAVIVATHGAGLSNMIFSEPGTVVVEGMCRVAFTAFSFRNLAYVLGHRYYGVFTKGSCIDLTPSNLTKPVSFYVNAAIKHKQKRKGKVNNRKGMILKQDW